MPRTALTTPRTAASARRLVLPVGMKGRASLAFDGTDDIVTGVFPPSMALVDGQATLAGWLRCADSRYAMALWLGNIALGQMNWVGTGTTAPFRFGCGIYGGALAGNRVVDPGVWHRVVATFSENNDKKMRVYVDGTIDGTSPAMSWNLTTGANARVGGFAGYYYKGNVDDARIYSRAWTHAEVSADYRGEWVNATGLVRWWKCENLDGGTTREEIGRTNDAVTGAIASVQSPFAARDAAPARTAVP